MSSASTLFHLATSAYLTLQSLPLLLSPTLITSLLSTSSGPSNSNNSYYDGPAPHRTTSIEIYLSRTLAFTLLSYAGLLLLLSGVIPVLPTYHAAAAATAAADENENENENEDRGGVSGKNPYHYPATIVTTFYHAMSAFYLYTQIVSFSTSIGMGTGLVVSGGLFCMGMWVVLFDGEKGHIGKRSGTDKRTSGWPFVNSQSSKEIKKRRKEEAEGAVRRRSPRLDE